MYKLAIVGATGLVGSTIIKVLEERALLISEYVLFASSKSVNKEIRVLGKNYYIKELNEHSFDDGIDFAIFAAGGDISKIYAPIAKAKGVIVIDNSSAFRMNDDVPLVVPEVNKEDICKHNGIIANPNCSTIQAVVALKPLDDKYKIKRVVYSTYQAVSGAGKIGIEDLEKGAHKEKLSKFPHPIFNNCLPQVDSFMDNQYTKEEMKMIAETRKILNKPDMRITATAVRVPVINCHSESINVEFENSFDIQELRETLKNSSGIIIEDNSNDNIYPMAMNSNGRDEVFVGRIRRDESVESGVNLWIVADNLRKGAATNAVQILEELIKKRH